MSRAKRWLFRLLALALAAGAIEAGAWLVWTIVHPELDWKTMREMQTVLQESAAGKPEGTEAIHPYLGWVLDPQATRNARVGDESNPVNELGFVDNAPSIVRRTDGAKIVGITGGSVALQMSWLAEAELRAELQRHPAFAGQEIRFVRLAMSGYKQPQQLMSLTYLLALGGELDYLINIDGFNEIALAVEDNFTGNVNLAYPRLWQHRLEDVVDPRTGSLSYRLLANRARRQSTAGWVANSWLRNSAAVNYLWSLYDGQLRQQQIALGEELREFARNHGRSFATGGPDDHLADRDAALVAAIELWAQSSRQLHRLCAANDIGYLHVLQPNQYHLGSKPFTELEREKFIAEGEKFGDAIRNGYPLAIVRGATLREDGIAFVDLTQLFATETDTLYADFCCHYNHRGNTLLATRVAQALADVANP